MNLYSIVAPEFQWLLYTIASWIVRVLLLLATLCNDYGDDSPQGPALLDYDYVIVGAGTAGSVIFGQMPAGVSVLLIEAGTEGGYRFADIPVMTPALRLTALDWSYLTAPQTSACRAMKDARCLLAAGRGHGGSNILNNMVYYRGDRNDFRGWFHHPDDYDYEEQIVPLFREMEQTFSANEILHRTDFGRAFDDLVVNVDRPDGGDGGNLTFTTPRVLQRDGFRWTMAHTARTNPSKLHRKLYSALATRILFDPARPTRVSALEVRKNDHVFRITARKGFILTLGAIGTPTLLLRSGVGPCTDLANHAIPCQHHLPNVGKNLQDHLATGMDLITLNTSLDLGLRGILSPANVYRFFFRGGHDSPWSTVGCESLGFYNHPELQAEGRPRLGFIVLPMGLSSDMGACLRQNLNIDPGVWHDYFRPLATQQTVSVLPVLLQPKSRGQVSLAAADFNVPPIVDPRYLTHADDIRVLLAGIEILRKDLVKTAELGRFNATITPRPLGRCAAFEFNSPAYWECYVGHVSFSVYHLGGTCRIGDPADPQTVVNRADFRVKGLDNLYVADASAMPNLPSGNSNAAVALIAKQFIRRLIERMDVEDGSSWEDRSSGKRRVSEAVEKNEL